MANKIWRNRNAKRTKKLGHKLLNPKQAARMHLENQVRGLPERVVESSSELDAALSADQEIEREHNVFPPDEQE